MAGLNRVLLVGYLSKDPRKMMNNTGLATCWFTVAVDNPPSSKNPEERTASFIECVCWGKTAENVAKFCTKGTLVGVEGRIKQSQRIDKNTGAKTYPLDIVAENVQFLSTKRNNNGADSAQSTNPYAGNSGFDSSSASATQNIGTADITEDDVPF